MSAEGMARVIEDHIIADAYGLHQDFIECGCGKRGLSLDEYTAHVADMLTAAGYGDQHDAWAEGHGASDEAWENPRDICDPPPDTTNPFPETT